MIEHLEMPEGLVAHDPRSTDLRVGDELHILAEGAVVVDAYRTGEKQPVAPRHLLLDEKTQRRIRHKVLATLDVGSRRCRR